MTPESNLVCGYTCQDHLLVDLDNCNLSECRKLTRMILKEWPFLGDVLITRSSPAHYHLIFDNILTWNEIIRIVETLAELGIVQKEYRDVRKFRRDLTLRISHKNGLDRIREVPEPVLSVAASWVSLDRKSEGIKRYVNCLQAFRDVMVFETIKESSL